MSDLTDKFPKNYCFQIYNFIYQVSGYIVLSPPKVGLFRRIMVMYCKLNLCFLTRIPLIMNDFRKGR